MTIHRMNGKDLKYEGFADFDSPHRAHETGKHTSLEAFDAQMKRAVRHGIAIYGWVWAEYKEIPVGKRAPFAITRIHEPILLPFKPWIEAKRRSLDVRPPLLTPSLGHADCCMKQAHCVEDHKNTARHFRYWCLQFPDLAIKTWPWIKELIAVDKFFRCMKCGEKVHYGCGGKSNTKLGPMGWCKPCRAEAALT